MSDEKGTVITRAQDVARFTEGEEPVETLALRAQVEEQPFYSFDPQMNPTELTEKLMEAYRLNSSEEARKAFAKCVRLSNEEGELRPHLQIFRDDVLLGNLGKEGFLRLVIDPSIPPEESLVKTRERVREIRRYVSGGVLGVSGFFMENPTSSEPIVGIEPTI